MVKKVFLISALCVCSLWVWGQDQKKVWVDSVFNKLKLHEKIGQLFMVSVSAYNDDDEIDDLLGIIRSYDPGGIYLRHGGPVNWINLYNRIQKISRVPLIVGMDAEWGPGQTLDSLMKFQKPLAIGAIRNDSLVGELGEEIARQMKLLGIHINFAPNGDVNFKQANPGRFYGTNKFRVSNTSVAFAKGLQQNGVLACPKHLFDVENTADIDSTIYFNFNRLDTLAFYPYHQLIKSGVGGLLTSNLHFSIRDKRKSVPASVSSIFINQIVRERFGFKGLTFSEISYLQRIANKTRPGETEALAFEIGNDFLIDVKDYKLTTKLIQKMVKKNPLLQNQLEQSVRKILSAKYDVGLRRKPSLTPDNIIRRINSEEALALKYKLVERSITIIKNENDILPLQKLDEKKYASLTIGKEADNEFSRFLGKYSHFTKYAVRTIADTLNLANELSQFDVVVVGIHPLASNFIQNLTPWINRVSRTTQTIVFIFGEAAIPTLDSPNAIALTYNDEDLSHKIAAQVVFGARQGFGSLPFTLSSKFQEGVGKTNSKLDRLGYGIPAEVEMNSEILKRINNITREAIDSGATPGCNVVVARHGKVIFEQSAGWQTYDNQIAVNENTIYDLASITKVTATLQTIMFLTERGLIDVHKKASLYLPELKKSNKKDFTLKDILTHQAGLWPYLPFWLQTMKDSILLTEYYSHSQTDDYPYPVAKDLFANKSVKDSLWQWIIRAKVRQKTPRTPFDYRYSDMGFYILQHLAEKKLNQPMQEFLDQNLYEPMGATTTGYLPLNKFPPQQIAPTEVDLQFRKSTLIGYVHDQGAAMHGGIAGHAGLFSSANDLAKLGQMWLQKGSYGGVQFFKPETIDYFTQQQYASSRRGLGWDKPTQSEWNGPTSLYASPTTFGHTGFTGTCVWVDPEFDLVYIFLSNRVYPDMNNGKLLSNNIRPRIQDVIYESIFEYCKFNND